MALVKRQRDEFGLRSLHNQIDDLFNDFFRGSSLFGDNRTVPSVDVYNEGNKHLVVETHVPGFSEDEIAINLQNGVLEVRGQRSDKQEDKNDKRGYMLRESSSQFYRRVALPDYIDEDKVSAELDKGVLKITLPLTEKAAPKRIRVTSGKRKKLAEKAK